MHPVAYENDLKSSWSGESAVNSWAYYSPETVLLPCFADSHSFNLKSIRTFDSF